MDFQKIESFLALAETLSFTKASNTVFKSQSVLSRQIVSMEEELGIQLFTRTKRRVELTPAGKALVPGLKKVLELYDSVIEEAMSIHTGYEGHIKICCAAGQSIGNSLGPVLRGFTQSYPNISIEIISKNIGDIRYMLQEGQIDLACGRTQDYDHFEDLEHRILASPGVYLVVSKEHPLAKASTICINETELDQYTMIWSRDISSKAIEQFISSRKSRLGISNILYAPNINTVLLWIELNRGFSFFNEFNNFRYNPAVRFIPIEQFGRTHECLMWRSSNPNPCIKKLADFTEQYRKRLHIS